MKDDPTEPIAASRPTALESASPPRNFTLTADARIRALAAGVPAYSLRKRRIEDAEQRMVATLVALARALEARDAEPTAITAALRERARAFDLAKVNALITTHNRYFPIEANLPIDRETGGFLLYGKPWRPEAAWTPERLLESVKAARDSA